MTGRARKKEYARVNGEAFSQERGCSSDADGAKQPATVAMAFYGKAVYWDARYQKTAQSYVICRITATRFGSTSPFCSFVRSIDQFVPLMHPVALRALIHTSCFFFTSRGPCEWYRSYAEVRHLLNPAAFSAADHGKAKAPPPPGGGGEALPSPAAQPSPPPRFPERDQCRVLIFGCGNSTFGADMLRDGWTGGIVNVDFSPAVVAQMQHAHAEMAGRLDYVCADLTQLPLDIFPAAASFDLIVCKGTLDALLCSAGGRGHALAAVREAHRLLAATGHGVFFVVTAGNPDSRLEYFEHRGELSHYWRGVSVHPLKDDDDDDNEGRLRRKQYVITLIHTRATRHGRYIYMYFRCGCGSLFWLILFFSFKNGLLLHLPQARDGRQLSGQGK